MTTTGDRLGPALALPERLPQLVAMVPRVVRIALSLPAIGSFLGASLGEARGVDPCPHHDRLPGVEGAPPYLPHAPPLPA